MFLRLVDLLLVWRVTTYRHWHRRRSWSGSKGRGRGVVWCRRLGYRGRRIRHGGMGDAWRCSPGWRCRLVGSSIRSQRRRCELRRRHHRLGRLLRRDLRHREASWVEGLLRRAAIRRGRGLTSWLDGRWRCRTSESRTLAHGRGDEWLRRRCSRGREVARISDRWLRRLVDKARQPRRLAGVRSVLDRHGAGRRAGELLDVGVVRVERRLGLRLDGLGVRLVGVLALADGLEDARGVPLGELDLLQRLGIGRAPLAREVEKGRGGVECVGRLSAAVSSATKAWRGRLTSSPCLRAECARRDQMSAAQTARHRPGLRHYRQWHRRRRG